MIVSAIYLLWFYNTLKWLNLQQVSKHKEKYIIRLSYRDWRNLFSFRFLISDIRSIRYRLFAIHFFKNVLFTLTAGKYILEMSKHHQQLLGWFCQSVPYPKVDLLRLLCGYLFGLSRLFNFFNLKRLLKELKEIKFYYFDTSGNSPVFVFCFITLDYFFRWF